MRKNMKEKLSGHSNPDPEAYRTKDNTFIRELLNDQVAPGLGLSLAEASLAAGEKSAEHLHHDFDEIYYCLEGRGTLYINGEPHPFLPHSFYLMRSGESHYLEAELALRLLCVCRPGYSHAGTKLL